MQPFIYLCPSNNKQGGSVQYIELATASDKVYQLLAHGRWFSPVSPASSNTGRHDIVEILLKEALITITLNQYIDQWDNALSAPDECYYRNSLYLTSTFLFITLQTIFREITIIRCLQTKQHKNIYMFEFAENLY